MGVGVIRSQAPVLVELWDAVDGGIREATRFTSAGDRTRVPAEQVRVVTSSDYTELGNLPCWIILNGIP